MRKAKALQIKFTDVKPAEAGSYIYRKDGRLKSMSKMQKADAHYENGMWFVLLDGIHEYRLDSMKGQFSQRIEVAK